MVLVDRIVFSFSGTPHAPSSSMNTSSNPLPSIAGNNSSSLSSSATSSWIPSSSILQFDFLWRFDFFLLWANLVSLNYNDVNYEVGYDTISMMNISLLRICTYWILLWGLPERLSIGLAAPKVGRTFDISKDADEFVSRFPRPILLKM